MHNQTNFNTDFKSTVPMDEAIQLLIESYNNDVNENDCLVEQLESLSAENEQLKALNTNYEKSAAVVLENVEKSEQTLAQANRERDQAINRAKDLEIQLRAFKEIAATPKKIREKIKGYQERLDRQRQASELHKRNTTDANKQITKLLTELDELTNRLDAAGINQVYRDGGDIVQTYPYHLGGMVEGFDQRMTPLLYLHQSGRGGLILLNDDGEAELVEAPRGGIRPKKATLDHCSQWLRRAKDKNWDLYRADLESLSHGSN